MLSFGGETILVDGVNLIILCWFWSTTYIFPVLSTAKFVALLKKLPKLPDVLIKIEGSALFITKVVVLPCKSTFLILSKSATIILFLFLSKAIPQR